MLSLKMAKKRTLCLLLVVVLIVTGLSACAQTPAPSTPAATPSGDAAAPAPINWPTKPISLVCGYTAGGTADIIGRILAREMGDYLGVSISTINVVGASGGIAGQQVSATSDGNTWLSVVAHTPSAWPVLGYNELSWNDYYFLAAGTSPYVIVANKDSKWANVDEMIEEIRANPGKFKWSSAGFGSIGQLAGELFVQALEIDVQHIGYNGGREAVLKVMSGEVDWNLAGYSDITDLIETGDVKVMGFMSQEDITIDYTATPFTAPSLLKKYPELVIGSELRSVWGLSIPRETPPEIMAKIQEAFEYAMKQDRLIEAFETRKLEMEQIVGYDSDVLCARLESLYAWGLYDTDVATKSPADYGIPRIEDFKWPPHERAEKMNPWP